MTASILANPTMAFTKLKLNEGMREYDESERPVAVRLDSVKSRQISVQDVGSSLSFFSSNLASYPSIVVLSAAHNLCAGPCFSSTHTVFLLYRTLVQPQVALFDIFMVLAA